MPTNVGSVSVEVRVDNKDALNELNKLRRNMGKLNDELKSKEAKRSSIEEEMSRVEVEANRARVQVEKLKAALEAAPRGDKSGIRAELTAANAELRRHTQTMDSLNAKWQGLGEDITAGKEKLGEMTDQAGMLEEQVKANSGAMAKLRGAAGKALSSMQKGFHRIRNMIVNVFWFRVISSGLRSLRSYLSEVIGAVPEVKEALSNLKGALMTAAQPLMDILIPAVVKFLNLLTRVAQALANVTATLFGTTASQSEANAKALYDQAKGYEEAGDAAEKASKQLAGFDQLNILHSDSGSGSSGSDSGSDAGVSPNFSQDMERELGSLEMLAGGALLALGMILTFTGASIPLGLGLMVLGAATLAASIPANWDAIVTALQGPIGKVVAIVSGALLVLGLILAFSGVALPLGIGLMVVGAAGLAATAALNWDTIVTALRGPIGKVVAIVSGALLVLGLILAFSGVALPLGIALILAGAAGLVTVSALNWDAIKEKIVGVWDSIKSWWREHVAPIFTVEWWKNKFDTIREGLEAKIKDGINAAIDLLNSFINWVNDKLHLSWGSFSLFGQEIIPAGEFQLLTLPTIPRLAQGAVIPPNREFLAVLGDQKSGTNIETPLETMVQAFRQALREGGGAGDMTIVITMDGEKIAEKTIQRINRNARASGRFSPV